VFQKVLFFKKKIADIKLLLNFVESLWRKTSLANKTVLKFSEKSHTLAA